MKRLAILLLLLATTTQAFVAQTHVHAGFAAQQASTSTTSGDERLPAGGEDSNCLLCQIASHGAAALASHQSTLLPVTQQYVVAALPDKPDPHSLPLTHAWSSRGPPRS